MSVGSRFVRNIDSPTWKRLRKFAVGRNRTMGSVFTELVTEPPRVFRRLFRLSHAAIAGWSNVA